MKKALQYFLVLFLFLGLMTGCSKESPSEEQTAADPAENADHSSQEEETEEPVKTPEEASPVTLDFVPSVYPDPDSDDYWIALLYASNTSESPMEVRISCQAFDHDGNTLSAFDQFRGNYINKYERSLYIPAGADHLPVAFVLPMGFRYDLSKDEYMPEIDHLSFEVIDTQISDQKDLHAHFTAAEPEIKENHIYVDVTFDQEIADNYTSVYMDYTFLGYANGSLTSVICRNDYPQGSSSLSVDYAKEKNDGALLLYHSIPREPVDRWDIFIRCVNAE